MKQEYINELWERLTPITVDGERWNNCVPLTNHVRPDNRKSIVPFPVVDEETVRRARDISDAGYTFHCEELSRGVWAFYLTDEVADYDADTKVFKNEGAENNRRAISDWIKSWSVEQLNVNRERYIEQENDSND